MDQSENLSRSAETPTAKPPELVHTAGAVESAPERVPGGEVHVGGPSNQVPSSPVPQVNTQLPAITAQPPVASAAVNDDTPLVAADDEVIEQEWVQKAKAIVSQTKADPFNQEKEVGRLQADYLKKRYGKEIKLASD